MGSRTQRGTEGTEHGGHRGRVLSGPLCSVSSVLFLCVLVFVGIVGGGAKLAAQFQMPDPKQMSGIPRPVTDLPDHAISVRLIRGALSNNITNRSEEHTSELQS